MPRGRYEAARTHCAALEKAGIGLLICDEGHRLKATGGNQTIDALLRIGRARRVILTGTPLQNNLHEFWALGEFVAPGELGPLSSFSHDIAAPIDAGRQPGASGAACGAAEAATARLRSLSEAFVHRRDASVLSTILPPRTELALFARLSPAQSAAYALAARWQDGETGKHVLGALTELRKIASMYDGGGPHNAKLNLLMRLLVPLHAAGEKVVVCSGFGGSLDLIEAAVRARGWGVERLDGTTKVDLRQSLVNRFNTVPGGRGLGCEDGCGDDVHGEDGASSDSPPPPFLFLLSTRAGGSGFNLVGASRLILYDPDWNPAMDTQAMGRVYRQVSIAACRSLPHLALTLSHLPPPPSLNGRVSAER